MDKETKRKAVRAALETYEMLRVRPLNKFEHMREERHNCDIMTLDINFVILGLQTVLRDELE